MVDLRISESPPGDFIADAAAIKAAATSIGLAQPLADMVNWLLASRQGVVFSGGWPTTVENLSSRIYHNPSVNCDRILVIAVIEKAAQAGGVLTITPDDGGGTAISVEVDDTTATTQFASPIWQTWMATAELVDQSAQYHTVVWTDLIVRSLTVLEVPRGLLDPSSDTAVALRAGPYSGLLSDRMITDSAVGTWEDILTGIASARTATKRHGSGVMFPDALPWSLTSAGVFGNIADAALGTVPAFGFRHQARAVDSATTQVTYTCKLRARSNGTGLADFKLNGTKDSFTIKSLGSSWAWYTSELDVAADAVDLLEPDGQTDDGTTAIAVSSIQYMEK